MKDNMADLEIDLEITNPKELMGLGLRAYALRDFSASAAALGRATQLMAQEHGDEHDSLGEVYLYYARALLEVSREEAEPLGDAIPRGESDSDSSQEEEVADNEAESEPTKDSATESEKVEEVEKQGDTDLEKKEDKDVEKEEENKVEQNGNSEKEKSEDKEVSQSTEVVTTNGDIASTSGTNGEADDENPDTTQKTEDCSDLQLAWEVLEVAKKIFSARGDTGKELLAQSLILLGEVAMESENFTDGVNDIQTGLELQESLYEKTSRKLAETYYKLGIAHTTISNIDDAVKYFDLSISTLTQRIDMLKEKDSEDNKTEIEEMESLIPEIKDKINDTKSIKEDTVKLIMEMSANTPKSTEEAPATSSTKEVKDISHLVKRKRKIEDTPESSEAQPTKKPTP